MTLLLCNKKKDKEYCIILNLMFTLLKIHNENTKHLLVSFLTLSKIE